MSSPAVKPGVRGLWRRNVSESACLFPSVPRSDDKPLNIVELQNTGGAGAASAEG
jgi:hypothetical protein